MLDVTEECVLLTGLNLHVPDNPEFGDATAYEATKAESKEETPPAPLTSATVS